MNRRIHLVNPRTDAPTYFGAEVVEGWGLAPATMTINLSLPTVAALIPERFHVSLCDEHLGPVDFDTSAPIVGITGNIAQQHRLLEIAGEFRRLGKTVVVGGPLATLCPEVVRPHCDVLVRGEIEEIAEGLFSDLERGSTRAEYVGTRPNLDLSPAPRWDLFPTERALTGAVQTSRGCPFECEFCDVVQYVGHRHRCKPVANVLAELDRLYELGFRSVIFTDDSLTVSRARTKELLRALRSWNRQRANGKVMFAAQLALDTASDPELLRLLAEAGLVHAFVGIESPDEQCLKEANKRPNLGIDPGQAVASFYEHGIMVVAGMIVGFDADGPDCFERHFRFAEETALPIVTVGALVAPAGSALFDRLAHTGRVQEHGSQVAATPWGTNVVPLQMTPDELMDGIRDLVRRLYDPMLFGARLRRFISRIGERRDPKHLGGEPVMWRQRRTVDGDALRVLGRLGILGLREGWMMLRTALAVIRRPQVLELVAPIMLHYAQLRFAFGRADGIFGRRTRNRRAAVASHTAAG